MRVRVSSGQALGPGREWLWNFRVTVIRVPTAAGRAEPSPLLRLLASDLAVKCVR